MITRLALARLPGMALRPVGDAPAHLLRSARAGGLVSVLPGAIPGGVHDLIGTPFVVLVLVVAAILTFVLNPRDRLVRIFALLLLTAALIVGIDPLFERHNGWGLAIDAAANGLGPALFLRFCLAYPHRQPRPVADEPGWWRAMFAYGPCVPLVAALIYIVTLPVDGEWPNRLGTVSICLGILFGLAGGLVMLGRTFLRDHAPRVRGPILVVWLGAALTFVPLMGDVVLPALFFRPSPIPFANLAYVLLLLPLSVGFATVRWGPFSLAAFIDRVSVYTALGGLLLACYAGLALLLTVWEGVPFSLVAATVSLALAVIAAGTFAPARAAIERAVDSVLYRDHYDLGKTLQGFSRSLAAIRDPAGVVATLLDGLCGTLNLSGAAFVSLPDGLSAEVLRLIEAGDLQGRRDFAKAEACAALAHALAQFEIPPERPRPRGGEQPPVLRNPWPGCAALVLIRGGDAQEVSALLLIGPKRGGGPLRGKDHVVLATIAHQAATALDNAILFGGLLTTVAQLRRSTEQLETARTEQRLLLGEVVDADERQRAALARDLHDDALQDLLYLSRHSRYCANLVPALNTLASGAPQAVQAARLRDELGQLALAATNAERKLRDLCAGLYPALLESLGLLAALESLAEDLGAAESVAVGVCYEDAVVGRAEELDGAVRLHVYRIAQEAVRNAARHAHGQRIAIHLALAMPTRRASAPALADRLAQLLLTIDDDGRCMRLPVDYAGLLRAGHLGLASMRERARRIGADLSLSQNERGGLCVRLGIPLAPVSGAPMGSTTGSTTGSTSRSRAHGAPARTPIVASPARGVE